MLAHLDSHATASLCQKRPSRIRGLSPWTERNLRQMSVLGDSRRPNNISSWSAIVATPLLTSVKKAWTSVKKVFYEIKSHQQNQTLIPYFPLMTNSVIQWKCRGLRPNFDELSLLIVKHNPLAVCLQETFLEDTDNITFRGFNLYHKCQETENRASGGVSILVNENVPQSIVTLNTNIQALAVKVTAHKTIKLCSVYLRLRNNFYFNPKDLQDLIDQLPSPFIFMGDFNGHYHFVGMWGCK